MMIKTIVDYIEYLRFKKKEIEKGHHLNEMHDRLKNAYIKMKARDTDEEFCSDVDDIVCQIDRLSNRIDQLIAMYEENNLSTVRQYPDLIKHEQKRLADMMRIFEAKWNVRVTSRTEENLG